MKRLFWCLLFLNSVAHGQIRFFKRIGLSTSDVGTTIKELPNGNFLLTTEGGVDFPQNTLVGGGLDLLSKDGQILWSSIHTEGDESFFYTATLVHPGGFVTTGPSGDFLQNCRTVLNFHDTNGNILQSQRVFSSGADYPTDMEWLPNGNILVLLCGDYNVWYETAILVEFDQLGNLVRADKYSLPSAEFNPKELEVTSDGEVYLSGTCSGGFVFTDGWIMKLDTNRDPVWAQKLGGYYDDEIWDMSVNASGNIGLAGFTYHLNTQWDGLVAEFTPDGALRSHRYFHAGDDEKFRCIRAQGNRWLVSGDAGSFEDRNIVWLRIDEQWQADWRYLLWWGNPFTNYPFDLVPTSDGGMLLTGDFTNQTGSRDPGILKTDASGSPSCQVYPWEFSLLDSSLTIQSLAVEHSSAEVQLSSTNLTEVNLNHGEFPVCEVVPPEARHFITDTVEDCPSICLTFQDSSLFSPTEVYWQINDTIGTGNTFTVCFPGPGKYGLFHRVSNADGVDSAFTWVEVPGVCPPIIPNVFSPNGDGVNDVFSIGSLPQNSRLTIYDRWGVMVFSSGAYANSWTGLAGIDAVYFYLLQTPNGKTYKGSIMQISD